MENRCWLCGKEIDLDDPKIPYRIEKEGLRCENCTKEKGDNA